MNKRIGRIRRWAFAAVVAGLVAPVLAAAGTTPGAQTVGWVPTSSSGGFQQAQCEPAGGRASFGWAQLASQNGLYTVPSDGVITSWTFTTGATAVDGLYLVVYQGGPAPTPNYNNTGSWTPVAWSPALNPLPAGLGSQPTTLSAGPGQAADTTVTYPARITVKAGDVLGVAASCMDWYPSPSPTSADFPFQVPFNAPQPTSPSLPQQTTATPYFVAVEETLREDGIDTLADWPGYRLPVSAQLEPDADGDGFGDGTQDLPRAARVGRGLPEGGPGPDRDSPGDVARPRHDVHADRDQQRARPRAGRGRDRPGSHRRDRPVSYRHQRHVHRIDNVDMPTRRTGHRTKRDDHPRPSRHSAWRGNAHCVISSQTLTSAAGNAPGAEDPDAANNLASATTTLLTPANPGGIGATTSSSLGGTIGVPVLSGLRESSANWKESRTPRSKLPVGDTFKFTLSEQATVALSFAAQRPGRRARGERA